MSLIIWDRVNTPAGKGILTAVYTPGNGLYIDYDNAKCSVYYEPRVKLDLNKDLIRDNELLIS